MIETVQQYKIISDGTPQGTKILDPDGKELKYATYVGFHIFANGFASATIELSNVEVQSEFTVNQVTIKQEEDEFLCE